MALELITESEADANSYGFRKFRSTADAIDALHRWLSRDCLPRWILEGDIKGCFDHINHEWLLNNVQIDRLVLRRWLKSGVVFNCKVSIDTLHFFFSLANLNPYLRCMKEDIRMRQKWLELYVETGSVTKTALRCGITRSTLYRWINCEKEQGKSELSDKSKRSSRLANMKITPEIETIILNLCVRQEDGERNGLPTICLGRE